MDAEALSMNHAAEDLPKFQVLKDCVNEIILSEHRISINGILDALNASIGTVHKIVCNTLQFLKKCACWLLKMLTGSQTIKTSNLFGTERTF